KPAAVEGQRVARRVRRQAEQAVQHDQAAAAVDRAGDGERSGPGLRQRPAIGKGAGQGQRLAVGVDGTGGARRDDDGPARGKARSRLERAAGQGERARGRSEEHTSELQSLAYLVCRLLLEKKKKKPNITRQENT